MTPEKVLNDVYRQLRPLVEELAKYNTSQDDLIKMAFEVGIVTFEFNNKHEDTNQ